MSLSISTRLQSIRTFMSQHNLDAFIIPRADEYLGEYVPACNERLHWTTGFTGSAGVAIILADSAAIFVDGRYTVQVRQQVSDELFSFHHLINEPFMSWLCHQLTQGQNVGLDSKTFSLKQFEQMQHLANEQHLGLVEIDNPIDTLWLDRPDAPSSGATRMDNHIAGINSFEKRQLIGHKISELGADAALMTASDSIAWLLNIRGRDIPCLPVVLSNAFLYADGRMTWFVDPKKLPEQFEIHVGEGVTVCSDTEYEHALKSLALESPKILADPATANAWSQLRLRESGAQLIAAPDPCLLPKACKNNAEIAGMRKAHQVDALAEVKFLVWLDQCVQTGQLPDEGQASDQLGRFRYANSDCVDLSFDTISAAGSNAAMCHYNHKNAATPSPLQMNTLYLVDSGGQYTFGTTDITRTVAIGQASDEMKERFTLVLKGMISLACQKFPKGTTGTQLDALARQYLWQYGLDFDHGTGHGVGHFLSVHEGPQRISTAPNSIALEPGMVISDEPGYYLDGGYGIRCENLLIVEPANFPDADRPFYQFDTLTYVPFDKTLIQQSMLSQQETKWINDYHEKVYQLVYPQIDAHDKVTQTWLKAATSAI